MNIILFGPPGAGKGTQSDTLVKDFNLYKISTGDLLREEIKKKSDLGSKIESTIQSGSFVSDDIINDLIAKIISNKKYFNRLIFDGYPRNLNQALNLNNLLKKYNQNITAVFTLNVSKEILVKRIMGRLICTKCGLIFNKFFNPSRKDNHDCEVKFLKVRSDDNEETLVKRHETYEKETLPILKHYKDYNILHEIDGSLDIIEINKEIRDIMETIETWLYYTYLYK